MIAGRIWEQRACPQDGLFRTDLALTFHSDLSLCCDVSPDNPVGVSTVVICHTDVCL